MSLIEGDVVGKGTSTSENPKSVRTQQNGLPFRKNAEGKNICGAKTNNGTPCQMAPMINGRCRLHGGLTPNGFDLPHTKTGRYSVYLPKHLKAQFEEAVTDPKILDLTANIALLDLRLNELLAQLASNETTESWNDLGNLLGPLEKAIEERNGTKAVALMNRVLEAWQTFYSNKETWEQIIEVSEARRRLTESERKRLIDMDLVLHADRAYMLVAFIQDVIIRHVQDQSVRASIAYEIRRVLADGFGRHAGPAGGGSGDTEDS